MYGILNAIGGAIWAPVSWMDPVLAMLVLALLVAAGSLVVFRWTSDQEKIRRSKAPIKAHLTGIFLFRHDLRLVLKSLFRALGLSLANLRFLAIPMAVMILPLIVIFTQLELRLGSRGLEPGATTILRVHLEPGSDLGAVEVEPPAGLLVDSPGVRVRDPRRGLHEVDWRLRGESPGTGDVVIRSEGGSVTKRVTVGPAAGALSPVRAAAGLGMLLFSPGEDPLPADAEVTRVELVYAQASYSFLGIEWAWWVLFLVFMILALFLLKKPLGVDF